MIGATSEPAMDGTDSTCLTLQAEADISHLDVISPDDTFIGCDPLFTKTGEVLLFELRSKGGYSRSAREVALLALESVPELSLSELSSSFIHMFWAFSNL
jgi:hypothetical protein